MSLQQVVSLLVQMMQVLECNQATSPVACVVSLDVNENVEVALNGFFVATDDPVELVTDDAVTDDTVTDDVVAVIAC